MQWIAWSWRPEGLQTGVALPPVPRWVAAVAPVVAARPVEVAVAAQPVAVAEGHKGAGAPF